MKDSENKENNLKNNGMRENKAEYDRQNKKQ